MFFFLGFALGVLFWGWLSDHIGRRKAMLLGISLYLLTSILCFAAHTIESLLIFRVFQGIGASCGSVLSQAIAREALPEQKRNHFFTMSGFVLAFAITLGPFIGGYLTQWFNWRAKTNT